MDHEQARGSGCPNRCKRDAVLRLLRGEDLETASRSLGVTAGTLSSWRESFLTGGEASLSTRPTNQFSLRRGDIGDARFWRIDRGADYGPLDGLTRHSIDVELIK